MSLYLDSVVINVQDLENSKNFWKKALGFEVKHENVDWVTLGEPKKEWAKLALQLTDKPKKELNRLHLDLKANDGAAEVERLKSLGATVIPWQYEPDSDFVVMTDPEGNEFCVVGPNLEKYH
jgi:catechol 2,3-dioxygenase-like lactoylglutathione lyase family enzyme